MEHTLLRHFQQLITTHTGLQIREQEREAFGKTLAARTKALHLSQPEHYYQLLERGAAQGTSGESEWKQLIVLLTNQESYFFRDKGQFTLLRERILPELIKRNRERRTLRIWSAGCSTGEEPYSLAMMVDELLPQRDNWNIFILGTDIKEAALEKARRGVYSPWSFRLVEPFLQQRYFQEQQGSYELTPRIRSMVRFGRGNLFKDEFPNRTASLDNMDLILCRNVFIYFEANAVAVVVDKFAQTLRDGGYLMTGHAELTTQNLKRLQAKVLPGSVVYQRVSEAPSDAPTANKAAATRTPASSSSPPAVPRAGITARLPASPQPTIPRAQPASRSPQPEITQAATAKLQEAEVLFRNGIYGGAAEKLEQLLRGEPQNYAALCLAAQAYANLGRHDEATRRCQQAIAINAFAPNPYRLLAQIAEEQGDSEEAKNLLKKVIYLAPAFIPAYLELGALYDKDGDAARAQKMSATALELLQALPPGAFVEPFGLAAQELIRQLR